MESLLVCGFGHVLQYDSFEGRSPSLATQADWLWSYEANKDALQWLQGIAAHVPRDSEGDEGARADEARDYQAEFERALLGTTAEPLTTDPEPMFLAPWHLRFAQQNNIAFPKESEGTSYEEDRQRFHAELCAALSADPCMIYRNTATDAPSLLCVKDSLVSDSGITFTSLTGDAQWISALGAFQKKLGLELAEDSPAWRLLSGVYQ